jgi:hypothetical protein
LKYQSLSQAPKGFDQSYEDTIQKVLQYCGNVAYMRQAVYCYQCKSVFQNPYGENKAPDGCKYCHMKYDGPEQYCLPDFWIQYQSKEGFIFVHGGIHWKNEARRKHDYRIYQELLNHDFKCFVIKNETISEATFSILFGWVITCLGCLLDNRRYVALYEQEKELGYLQKAVVERYKQ